MKTTKRALFSSVMALILCFSMLVGTTFAWFTDEVKSGTNQIVAGNLDVEVYYGDPAAKNRIQGIETLFNDVTLWEPGAVAYENLTVVNEGTLALKYQLSVNFTNENTVDGYGLSQVLQVAVVEDGFNGTREEAMALNGTTLADFMLPGELAAKEAKTYGIVIWWAPSDADNNYNVNNGKETSNGKEYLHIDLGVRLIATQLAAEEDSFDKYYDGATAWYGDIDTAWYNTTDTEFVIGTAEELAGLAQLVNNGTDSFKGKTIKLASNINLNNLPWAPVGNWNNAFEGTFNGNGHTIYNLSINDAQGEGVGLFGVVANSTIMNVNLCNVEINAYSMVAGLVGAAYPAIISNCHVSGDVNIVAEWAYVAGVAGYCYYGTQVDGCSVVAEDGSLIQSVTRNAVGGITAWLLEGDHKVTNCQVENLNLVGWTNVGGITGFVHYNNTIEGCSVENVNLVKTRVDGNPGIGLIAGGYSYNANNAITLKNNAVKNVSLSGNHIAYSSYNMLYGSEYGGATTANFLLENNTTENITNNLVEVTKITDGLVQTSNGVYQVSNANGLKAALSTAAAAKAGDNTIVLTCDIDLTGTAWTPVKVDGYNGAGVVTIEGNGATIKGLTAPLFAGGFAGKSGIVIKNLTIADSNIVSTSGLGGGAFVDTADSMQVITLENCHLLNSTVTGERVGGLIGWVSGYSNQNDGPVKTYVTITNCSVIDSTVTGAGSAGAIAGHPGASDWTWTTIENCTVKNVDVVSNDDGSWRTGAIVGTANNGHVVINNVTVEAVTLTQDGVTATETKLFGRFVPAGTGTLEIDGAPVVATADALKAALSAETENISVILGANVSVDIGTGWKMGGANTKSITIDGNGHTLTLSSTYRSYFNLANAEGVLNLKNMTLTNAHKGTHFFDYTTHFNCDVVAENVVFAKSPLVSGGVKAVFTDCEFSQAGTDIYGLWIMSGSDVTVNGGELKTDRGFKIADEDSAKEMTTLKVSGTKFNNTKKAAILVTTNYGATITLENLDITNCGADSTNAVWIDDGRTATADKITVTGGSVIIEP